MRSKGLAVEHIVLIIVGLIVLGIIVMLIFLPTGPFRCKIEESRCQASFIEWCSDETKVVPSQCQNPSEVKCNFKPFPGARVCSGD